MKKIIIINAFLVLGMLSFFGYFGYTAAHDLTVSMDSINKALNGTNQYIGLSSDQVYQMAESLNEASKSFDNGKLKTKDFVSILSQLISTGRYTKDQIKPIAKQIAQLMIATGMSQKDVFKNLDELAKSPLKASEELNKKYHYLTATQLEHIKNLTEEGN
jgi:phage-related minor tail protein